MKAIRILNLKDKKVVAEKAFFCNNFFSYSKGLMFSKHDECFFDLKKPRREGVHMFFVRNDLMLFWLDDGLKVVEAVKALKATLNPETWRIYFPKTPCRYLLELGLKKARNLKVGDKVKLIHNDLSIK